MEPSQEPTNDILFGIAQFESNLNDTNASPELRAASLSWLIHLVGDIHQPLHCESFYSDAYTNGDRGGNEFYVKPADQPVRLHGVWDGLLGPSPNTQMQWRYAIKLGTEFPRASLAELTSHPAPKDWSLESRELLSHSPTRLKAVVHDPVIVPVGVTGPVHPIATDPVGIVADPVADQHFVAGLYNDVLGREPSLGEVTGWVNSLQSGASRSLAIQMFLGGSEYRAREIQGGYATFLGRSAENAAQSYWLGQMQAGASYKTLLAGLLGSNEYYAKEGNNPTGFVQALYANLLYRAPEAGTVERAVGRENSRTEARRHGRQAGRAWCDGFARQDVRVRDARRAVAVHEVEVVVGQHRVRPLHLHQVPAHVRHGQTQ